MKKEYTIYYDEAGRGPLAGPMYIGLVCFLKELKESELEIFCDSKKLSEKQRENHFKIIQGLDNEGKIVYSPARVTACEIDKYGMTNSLHYAILRGLIQIFEGFFPEEFKGLDKCPQPLDKKIMRKNQISYAEVLSAFSKINGHGVKINLIMDGNSDFGLKKIFPFREIKKIVHGDASEKGISMASIVAKVSRDRIMETLPKKYDKYNFPKHKGYGTKEHKELLEKYGASDIHRKLFLKWMYPEHKIDKKIAKQF